jgi:hypothetical protein
MNNVDTVGARSWRRFLQFRLRTLLVLPVLVALGGYWYMQRRKAEAAREDYRRAIALRDSGAGEATAVDLCELSLRICRAEQQMPLARSQRPWALHLARVIDLEVYTQWEVGAKHTQEGIAEAREQLVRTAEFRREAVDALDPP